jgi:molybdate transport system regulatory protein
MKISARNIFQGSISAITQGSVNSEVEISLGGNDKLVAIVTNASASSLKLSQGLTVTAIIKASSVLVMTDSTGIKLSARNVLSGTVSKINNGPISSEVSISLASGATVHATITHEAVTELGLQQGSNASAVFKASSVILGVSA